MLKPMRSIGPFRADAEMLCVGHHEVELLTTKGAGMLPVVVRDLVTDEILLFSGDGQPAPGEDRAPLEEGVDIPRKRLDPHIYEELKAARRIADVRRAMCSQLARHVPGSEAAQAVYEAMKAVNDALG